MSSAPARSRQHSKDYERGSSQPQQQTPSAENSPLPALPSGYTEDQVVWFADQMGYSLSGIIKTTGDILHPTSAVDPFPEYMELAHTLDKRFKRLQVTWDDLSNTSVFEREPTVLHPSQIGTEYRPETTRVSRAVIPKSIRNDIEFGRLKRSAYLLREDAQDLMDRIHQYDSDPLKEFNNVHFPEMPKNKLSIDLAYEKLKEDFSALEVNRSEARKRAEESAAAKMRESRRAETRGGKSFRTLESLPIRSRTRELAPQTSQTAGGHTHHSSGEGRHTAHEAHYETGRMQERSYRPSETQGALRSSRNYRQPLHPEVHSDDGHSAPSVSRRRYVVSSSDESSRGYGSSRSSRSHGMESHHYSTPASSFERLPEKYALYAPHHPSVSGESRGHRARSVSPVRYRTVREIPAGTQRVPKIDRHRSTVSASNVSEPTRRYSERSQGYRSLSAEYHEPSYTTRPRATRVYPAPEKYRSKYSTRARSDFATYR